MCIRDSPVTADFFPDIINPFDTNILPDLVGALNNQLPPLPGADLQALNTGLQYGNLNQLQASGLTTNQEILLEGQPLYKAMARKSNLNKQKQTTNRNLIS